MLFRDPSTDGLSTSTIHDNQPAKSPSGANCCSVLVDHAIGQWRRRFKCVVQQQGERIKHLMRKLRDVTFALDNDRDNKQIVFCCYFLQLQISLGFQLLLLRIKTPIFH